MNTGVGQHRQMLRGTVQSQFGGTPRHRAARAREAATAVFLGIAELEGKEVNKRRVAAPCRPAPACVLAGFG